MPTMPPEAANRPKPKVPYAENNFMDLPKPVVPKMENRKLLKGQKAIVTGASSGIGRSIALALGHAGAAVCVNYVAGEDKAQAMVDELQGHGHTAFSFRADVSSETEVAAMFEAVRDEFGTADILVNNAGYGLFSPVEQTPDSEARAVRHEPVCPLGCTEGSTAKFAKESQKGFAALVNARRGCLARVGCLLRQ